jgi:hypothetical protein
MIMGICSIFAGFPLINQPILFSLINKNSKKIYFASKKMKMLFFLLRDHFMVTDGADKIYGDCLVMKRKVGH